MSEELVFRKAGEPPVVVQQPLQDEVDSAIAHARRPEVMSVQQVSSRQVVDAMRKAAVHRVLSEQGALTKRARRRLEQPPK